MTDKKREHLKQMAQTMKKKKNKSQSKRIYVYSSRCKMNHEKRAEHGERILKEKMFSRL